MKTFGRSGRWVAAVLVAIVVGLFVQPSTSHAAVDWRQAVRYGQECDGPAWDAYWTGWFNGDAIGDNLPSGLCGHRAEVLAVAGDQCLNDYHDAVEAYWDGVHADGDYLNDWTTHMRESCAWSLIAVAVTHDPGGYY